MLAIGARNTEEVAFLIDADLDGDGLVGGARLGSKRLDASPQLFDARFDLVLDDSLRLRGRGRKRVLRRGRGGIDDGHAGVGANSGVIVDPVDAGGSARTTSADFDQNKQRTPNHPAGHAGEDIAGPPTIAFSSRRGAARR